MGPKPKGGLALLLGAPKSPGDDAEDTAASDLDSAAEDALNAELDMPARVAALKQAIKLCMGEDY